MNVINRLIPADQLHFQEDGTYSTVCKEEVMEIARKCEELNADLTHEQKIAIIG